MENTPFLETNRLYLRKFTESDLEPLFLIMSDREVNTFLPWFPFESLEQTEKYLQGHFLDFYKEPSGYRYAVCLKTDNLPIGYVHMSQGESHDFGYGLRKEFWRQGIASEAAKAAVERIEKDGVPFITATHDVKNPASGAVMRKTGMKYQYSYEELWQPKNIKVTFRMYQLNFDQDSQYVYRGYWEQYPVHFVEELD